MSFNKVIILGNLGADPESRFTRSGQQVVNMRIATSEKWNKDGQSQESTEWHSVVVWGKQAETCARYLTKGRTVLVEGRLQTRSFEDTNGAKRYKTEIVASGVKFVGRGDGGGGQYVAPPPADRPSAPQQDVQPDFDDDSIPF